METTAPHLSAETLMRKYPNVFPPAKQQLATCDATINARLSAIGPYKVKKDSQLNCLDIEWLFQDTLEADPAPFELTFLTYACGNAKPTPDNEMLALWDRYQQLHKSCIPDYRRLIIEHYRTIFTNSQDEDYPSNLSDEEILEMVTGAVVTIARDDSEDEDKKYQMNVLFYVEFDDEHGVSLRIDPTRNVVESD